MFQVVRATDVWSIKESGGSADSHGRGNHKEAYPFPDDSHYFSPSPGWAMPCGRQTPSPVLQCVPDFLLPSELFHDFDRHRLPIRSFAPRR